MKLNKYLNYVTLPKLRDWVTHNLHNYLAKNSETESEIFTILYFLGSASAPKNIVRISYPAAKKLAAKWLVQIEYLNILSESPLDVLVVKEFEDKFKIVQLKTKKSYTRESYLMHHCANNYFSAKDSRLYSLRDENNRPIATIQVANLLNEIVQIKSKFNKKVPHVYQSYVKEFIDEANFFMGAHDWRNLGYIFISHKIYQNLKQICKPFPVTKHFEGWVIPQSNPLEIFESRSPFFSKLLIKFSSINYIKLAEWAILNYQENVLNYALKYIPRDDFDRLCFNSRYKLLQDVILQEQDETIALAVINNISDLSQLQQIFETSQISLFGSNSKTAVKILNKFPKLHYPNMLLDCLVSQSSVVEISEVLNFYPNKFSKEKSLDFIYGWAQALHWAFKHNETEIFNLINSLAEQTEVKDLLISCIRNHDLSLYKFFLDNYPLSIEELLELNSFIELSSPSNV